jgi:hypothetical protein
VPPTRGQKQHIRRAETRLLEPEARGGGAKTIWAGPFFLRRHATRLGFQAVPWMCEEKRARSRKARVHIIKPIAVALGHGRTHRHEQLVQARLPWKRGEPAVHSRPLDVLTERSRTRKGQVFHQVPVRPVAAKASIRFVEEGRQSGVKGARGRQKRLRVTGSVQPEKFNNNRSNPIGTK